MNVVKPSRIREYARKHARAAASLGLWLVKVRHAKWSCFVDVRATFGSADQVAVGSNKQIIVFNIGGNSFRLICAAHFNRQNLYVLRFLTHAEYNRNGWKNEL
jgi:mRNA interferase HigB